MSNNIIFNNNIFNLKIHDVSNTHITYRICKNNASWIFWNEFYLLFSSKNQEQIIISIINALKTCPFDEYYLEFSPVENNFIDVVTFEFVIIKTYGFSINADINTFGSNNLNSNNPNIYIFPSLSKTSILLSPHYMHNYDINIYSHIGSFMKSNNFVQQYNLVKIMFIVYHNQLVSNPHKNFWLSTHGKGVAWLHIRIDPTSKYTSWNPYKIKN